MVVAEAGPKNLCVKIRDFKICQKILRLVHINLSAIAKRDQIGSLKITASGTKITNLITTIIAKDARPKK